MLTKFRLSKITSLVASALLFLTLWGVIEAAGWSGSAAAPPSPAPVSFAQEPVPTEPPPVVVQRTIVVRRIHQLGETEPPAPAAALAPSAPSSVQAQAPAAPPPQAAPQPAPPSQPNPKPVASTRAS